MKSFAVASFVLVFTTCSLATHAQNLLVNGSFELPLLAPNSSSITVPASWQAVTPPSLHNGAIASQSLSQEGQQHIGVGVEGNGSPNAIFQEVVVNNSGTYALEWYDAAPIGFGTFSPYTMLLSDELDQEVFSESFDAYHGNNRLGASPDYYSAYSWNV